MPKLKRAAGGKVVRALEQRGWYVERIKGSHHIMRHPERSRVTISVPVHGPTPLPIGTLASILRDA